MNLTQSIIIAFTAATISTAGFAAGSDSTKPPVKTQTTKECKNGKVWHEKRARCVRLKTSSLSDDDLYKAARELAYDGQYENALNVLSFAENKDDPRILNYKGFANRKAGRTDVAMTYYQAALAIDPDYILARSYMGQGMIVDGNIAGAKAQLAQIAERGGESTWAYASLNKAIAGEASDY